jgi:hypothetical protein
LKPNEGTNVDVGSSGSEEGKGDGPKPEDLTRGDERLSAQLSGSLSETGIKGEERERREVFEGPSEGERSVGTKPGVRTSKPVPEKRDEGRNVSDEQGAEQ